MEWSRVGLDKYSGILLAMLMQRRLGRSMAAPGRQVIRQNPSATLAPPPSQLFNRRFILRKTKFFYIKTQFCFSDSNANFVQEYIGIRIYIIFFNIILLHTICNKICLPNTVLRQINTLKITLSFDLKSRIYYIVFKTNVLGTLQVSMGPLPSVCKPKNSIQINTVTTNDCVMYC